MNYGDNMINLICACTDLGVHIDGTQEGPREIARLINKKNINEKIFITKNNVIKEKNKTNLKKNFDEIKLFLNNLYNEVNNSIKSNNFPITLGGDHTVAISSILASLNNNDDLGVIWIDAHADFNTFETTETGNIHGLPLAASGGLCKDLTNHFATKYINPKKCVIVGARSIDKEELSNLKKHNVTYFSTIDIREKGINTILDKAFEITGENVHISYDLDVIDPNIAPGVSVPEINGINEEEALEIINYLRTKKDIIESFDLVEYNPSFDNNNKTLNIALKLLNKLIDD